MASQEENSVLLARIDERTKNIQKQISGIESEMQNLKNKVEDDFVLLEKRSRDQYITKDTFLPVQRAMFTAMTTIVAAVIMAVLNFTFR